MFCWNDRAPYIKPPLLYSWLEMLLYMLNERMIFALKKWKLKRFFFLYFQYTPNMIYYFCPVLRGFPHSSSAGLIDLRSYQALRTRRAKLVCGVSVKRFPLIHFICSATSKPFVHTAPVPRWPSPPKHREWRCKTQTVKKKPSGQRKRWGGAEGGGRHAGQSKWQTAVKSVLWAPTYMWSRMTCELSQLPLVFR